jgi:succinate dehydrogenase / fumarate reductase, cytochrome b subunit
MKSTSLMKNTSFMKNAPSASNLLGWFWPGNHSTSTWGFILNRITALGLTLYLFVHLIALSQMAMGPAAYDAFIKLAHTLPVKMGEMLVIAGGLIHGLNGIRIALTSFGVGTRYQKQIFYGLMLVAVVGIVYFGYKMFAA